MFTVILSAIPETGHAHKQLHVEMAISENVQVVPLHYLPFVGLPDFLNHDFVTLQVRRIPAGIRAVIEHEQARLYRVGNLRQFG